MADDGEVKVRVSYSKSHFDKDTGWRTRYSIDPARDKREKEILARRAENDRRRAEADKARVLARSQKGHRHAHATATKVINVFGFAGRRLASMSVVVFVLFVMLVNYWVIDTFGAMGDGVGYWTAGFTDFQGNIMYQFDVVQWIYDFGSAVESKIQWAEFGQNITEYVDFLKYVLGDFSILWNEISADGLDFAEIVGMLFTIWIEFFRMGWAFFGVIVNTLILIWDEFSEVLHIFIGNPLRLMLMVVGVKQGGELNWLWDLITLDWAIPLLPKELFTMWSSI